MVVLTCFFPVRWREGRRRVSHRMRRRGEGLSQDVSAGRTHRLGRVPQGNRRGRWSIGRPDQPSSVSGRGQTRQRCRGWTRCRRRWSEDCQRLDRILNLSFFGLRWRLLFSSIVLPSPEDILSKAVPYPVVINLLCYSIRSGIVSQKALLEVGTSHFCVAWNVIFSCFDYESLRYKWKHSKSWIPLFYCGESYKHTIN